MFFYKKIKFKEIRNKLSINNRYITFLYNCYLYIYMIIREQFIHIKFYSL